MQRKGSDIERALNPDNQDDEGMGRSDTLSLHIPLGSTETQSGDEVGGRGSSRGGRKSSKKTSSRARKGATSSF